MTEITIEAVLFDMGGVILEMSGSRGFPNSRADWRGRQAMLRVISSAGGKADLEDLERCVFTPWRAAHDRREETASEASWTPYLDLLRRVSGCQLEDFELLRVWFEPYGEQLRPIAGAVSALEEISRAGYKMGLVSNVPLPGELYLDVLRRHGAAAMFDVTLFSYDFGSRKPLPAMLRRAMSDLGSLPETTLMVGDRRERDIAAGRFAGTHTLWIRSVDAGGPPADVELQSLRELPRLLRGWKR